MGNVFFTADEHHGHRNIIKFCNRPFENVDEMTDKLVENHNRIVRPGDTTYHIGDMFWRTFGPVSAIQVLQRLNGTHCYIRGNHEELIDKVPQLRDQFVYVAERRKIKLYGGPIAGIVLDHYAGRVWEGSHRGSWQLYGHTHAVLEEEPYLLSCDVGVDAWNYRPVALEEIAVKMETKLPAFHERQAHFERLEREQGRE